MSVSAQVLTSFFSFNAFFLETHDRLHQKTGLICVNDLSCPLHFMFCLHEQTSKLSVHIWHVPNSHRTKTLGNFRIEFRNLFGRMCGSRIKKTCLSRKKKRKKKTNNSSTNDLDESKHFLCPNKSLRLIYCVSFVCLLAFWIKTLSFKRFLFREMHQSITRILTI